MKTNSIATIVAALVLSACGGGGGGGSGPGGNSATYSYVAPPVGQTSSYAYTITDVKKDSASYNFKATVTSVNTDGSFVMSWIPDQTTYTLGGTSFLLSGETDVYNSTGDEVEYTPTDQQNFNCYYTNSAVPATLTAGQNFSATTSVHCTGSSTSSSYTSNNTYVGTESVTVPAGTFTAYKFQYTETDPAPAGSGGTITTNTTSWYDTSSKGTRTIRSTRQFTYNGYTPADTATQTFDMQLTSAQ